MYTRIYVRVHLYAFQSHTSARLRMRRWTLGLFSLSLIDSLLWVKGGDGRPKVHTDSDFLYVHMRCSTVKPEEVYVHAYTIISYIYVPLP